VSTVTDPVSSQEVEDTTPIVRLRKHVEVIQRTRHEIESYVDEVSLMKIAPQADYTAVGLAQLGDALLKGRAAGERAAGLLAKAFRAKGMADAHIRQARGIYQDQFDATTVPLAKINQELSWDERKSATRVRMLDFEQLLRKGETQYDIILALVQAIQALERVISRSRGDLTPIVDVMRVERSLATDVSGRSTT
jgi:hypothetical protein